MPGGTKTSTQHRRKILELISEMISQSNERNGKLGKLLSGRVEGMRIERNQVGRQQGSKTA
jgi:hypothetical protein